MTAKKPKCNKFFLLPHMVRGSNPMSRSKDLVIRFYFPDDYYGVARCEGKKWHKGFHHATIKWPDSVCVKKKDWVER